MAVRIAFTTWPLRSRTYPRRPQRFFQAGAEFWNERISSPGCIASINSEASGPNRRATASGDDRRELIQLAGGDWSDIPVTHTPRGNVAFGQEVLTAPNTPAENRPSRKAREFLSAARLWQVTITTAESECIRGCHPMPREVVPRFVPMPLAWRAVRWL